MKLKNILLVVVSLVCTIQTIKAEEFWQQSSYNNRDKIILRVGLQTGGDTVATIGEENNTTYEEKVRAGGYYQAAVGYDIAFRDNPFSLQVSYGLARDSARSSNLSMAAIHTKLFELIPFYHYQQHRIGLGVTHHLDPVAYLKLTGVVDYEYHFEDTTTWVLQYDYKYSRSVMFGLRYSQADYTAEAAYLNGSANAALTTLISGSEMNADSFGAHVIFTF